MKKIRLTPPWLGVPDCLWRTRCFTFGCGWVGPVTRITRSNGSDWHQTKKSIIFQLWLFEVFKERTVFSFFCDMKSVKFFFPCGASCQRLYWKKGTWIISCFLVWLKEESVRLWGCSVGKHLSDNQTNAIPKGSSLIHHFRAKPSRLIKKTGHSAGGFSMLFIGQILPRRT